MKRIRFSLWFLAALVLAGCTMSTPTMRLALKHTYEPHEGHYAELSNYIFGKKAMRTGMIRPEKFKKVIGFGIFLTQAHDQEKTPVLLVHGHGSGPRAYRFVGRSLDEEFEPWYAFYPSGLDIDESASMLRQSLAKMAEKHDVSRVVLVGHSQGGLVVRKAIDDAEDGVTMPEIPALLGISSPWGGTEMANFGIDTALALPAWHDMAVGSDFIETLFDRPLPFKTSFHIFYGLAGDNERIPGEDDGAISEESLTRKEAVVEAASVNDYQHVGHSDILLDQQVMDRINEVLQESAN